MKNTRFIEAMIVILAALHAPGVAAEGWRISAGPAWRGGMDMKAGGASYVQDSSLRPAPGPVEQSSRAWQTTPPWFYDDGRAYANRDFDNGFVYMDASTALNGDTWYWEYRDRSQYSAAADTLTFTRSATRAGASYGERIRSVANLDVPLSASDRLSGAGLELAFEKLLTSTGRVGVAMAFGFDAIWGIGGDVRTTTMEGAATREWVEQNFQVRTDSTFVYDLKGVVPPFPYTGTYEGPEFGADAPIIPNRPMRVEQRQVTIPGAERVLSSAGSQGRNRVSLSTDAALYEFWAGPVFLMKAGSKARLSLRPQISVNLVDASASRREAWLEAGAGVSESEVFVWNDQSSKTALTPGCGLHGALAIQLGRGWSIGAAAGYDWLLEDCSLAVGPNRIKLDLSGYTVSAQLQRQL